MKLIERTMQDKEAIEYTLRDGFKGYNDYSYHEVVDEFISDFGYEAFWNLINEIGWRA